MPVPVTPAQTALPFVAEALAQASLEGRQAPLSQLGRSSFEAFAEPVIGPRVRADPVATAPPATNGRAVCAGMTVREINHPAADRFPTAWRPCPAPLVDGTEW
jgi:hypothetical protein